MLRSAGRLGRKGELFLVAQQIDGGRFTCIRAPRKGNLGDIEAGQIAQMINRGKKTGLPEKGHRRRKQAVQ